MEKKCVWHEKSLCDNVTELICEILAYTGRNREQMLVVLMTELMLGTF